MLLKCLWGSEEHVGRVSLRGLLYVWLPSAAAMPTIQWPFGPSRCQAKGTSNTQSLCSSSHSHLCLGRKTVFRLALGQASFPALTLIYCFHSSSLKEALQVSPPSSWGNWNKVKWLCQSLTVFSYFTLMFTFFACSVKMDPGPLNGLPLPSSKSLPVGGTREMLEEKKICIFLDFNFSQWASEPGLWRVQAP